MQYNLLGTGLAITTEIREYIEKRLARLEVLLGGETAVHADIELQFQKSEDKKYRAECTLACAGRVYRAEALGESLHEAIDLASGSLVQDVERAQKKRLSLMRRGAARVKEFVRGFRG